MATGNLPEETKQAFTTIYLIGGNVAAASREAGISVQQGYRLRNEALKDPGFLEARSSGRERIESDAELMALRAMQICMERLEHDPDVRLDRILEKVGEKGRVQFQDPGPQYAASFAKLVQVVIGIKRLDAEIAGLLRRPGEVNINVMPTREAAARIENERAGS